MHASRNICSSIVNLFSLIDKMFSSGSVNDSHIYEPCAVHLPLASVEDSCTIENICYSQVCLPGDDNEGSYALANSCNSQYEMLSHVDTTLPVSLCITNEYR